MPKIYQTLLASVEKSSGHAEPKNQIQLAMEALITKVKVNMDAGEHLSIEQNGTLREVVDQAEQNATTQIPVAVRPRL